MNTYEDARAKTVYGRLIRISGEMEGIMDIWNRDREGFKHREFYSRIIEDAIRRADKYKEELEKKGYTLEMFDAPAIWKLWNQAVGALEAAEHIAMTANRKDIREDVDAYSREKEPIADALADEIADEDIGYFAGKAVTLKVPSEAWMTA
jgi:predicted deacetylase